MVALEKASEARTTGPDILVIDDDADVRASVSEILRASGFDVDEAADGDAALSLMSVRNYGVVLLDLHMPKRDGVSVVEALPDPPPVVVHSAYLLGGAERSRLGEKLVRYLRKPVSPQELLSAVEVVIGPAPV
jgi:CheY-like chemotaxis protein